MHDLISKKCPITYVSLSKAHQQNIYVNLGKRFKYSEWRDRVGCMVCKLLSPNIQRNLDLNLGRIFIASKKKHKS